MKNTSLFFILLFLLSCMGHITSDIYLPALPTIRHVFHTTTHIIQLSVAMFMFGFAFSHLIYGPLSDSLGRKKPLLMGILITIAGTLLCQYAENIGIFLMGRLLQGTGAGAAAVLFRSILRDVCSGNQLAKVGSLIGISRVILLASSPLIGSYLLGYFGWKACFWFLLIYAVLCFMGTLGILKETNQYQHLHKGNFYHIFKNILILLRNPIFMGYSICIMLTFGGILAWLTSLPIILQEIVGLTPIQFGWITALAGLFFAIGGFINAMLVEHFGLNQMIKIGLVIMFFGGLLMLWPGVRGTINTMVIMIPVVTYIIGSSMIFSNAYAGAFHPFPKIAGTAGAVFGFLQILGGAISSLLMSFAHSSNQIPLAIALIMSSLLAFLIIVLSTRSNIIPSAARDLLN